MTVRPKSLAATLLFSIAPVCCLIAPVLAQQSTWRIKNRFQSSYEFDSNIRERPSGSLDRLDASSLKLFFHSKASRRARNVRLTLTYQGGLQTYWQNSIENKLINEVSGSGLLQKGRFQIGFQAEARLKIYVNDVLDYTRGSAKVFLRTPAVLGFGNEVSVQGGGIHYKNFSTFDSSHLALAWTLSRKVKKNLSWNMTVTRMAVDYDRPALLFDASLDNLIVAAEQQEDESTQFATRIGYSKRVLVSLSYSLQHNDSNSFGYSYTRHQVVAVLGLPLGRQMWLRAYGATQIKNYSEESPPMFPIDVDSERDESNFLVVDLSKDLASGLTAILRYGYYNNESIIRSRFYSKSIVSAGFDFRF